MSRDVGESAPPGHGPEAWAAWLEEGFRWRDGPRLVRFAPGAAAEASHLLASEGLTPFVLLTTPRHARAVPDLAAAAAAVVEVPAGPVPEATAAAERAMGGGRSSALVGSGGDERSAPALVALGGGRVIDTAKALAAAHGAAAAALPTTLSGAEMSSGHRPLPDGRGADPVSPRLVITDPGLLTQPFEQLAAGAMNAFGHALEALYVPARNPVASLAALEGVRLLVAGLEAAEGERGALALGGLLAGYAIGHTGLGFHHALCQTIVRETGTPHAQVYAAMAPASLRFVAGRLSREVAPLLALLAGSPEPEGTGPAAVIWQDAPLTSAANEEVAVARLARLAALSGVTGLAGLGVAAGQLRAIAETAARRAEVRTRPPRPSQADLLALLREAL